MRITRFIINLIFTSYCLGHLFYMILSITVTVEWVLLAAFGTVDMTPLKPTYLVLSQSQGLVMCPESIFTFISFCHFPWRVSWWPFAAPSLTLGQAEAPSPLHFGNFPGHHQEDNKDNTKANKRNKNAVKVYSFEISQYCGMFSAIYNSPRYNKWKSLLLLFVIEKWIASGSCHMISQTVSHKIWSPWRKEKQSEQHSFLQKKFILMCVIFVFLVFISIVNWKVNCHDFFLLVYMCSDIYTHSIV